jgi:putative oxygen-independent coproporphyrinogen III oxidase
MDHLKNYSQFGIYIHFPYCTRRCPYCDFTLTTRKAPQEEYTQAILNELRLRIQKHPQLLDKTLISIYFGGGTPSLWESQCLSIVIEQIKTQFKPVNALEITIEANPEALTLEQAIEWKAIGINRISLGAQSFDTQDLLFLGRCHTGAQIVEAVGFLRQAGLSNISLDLIHGLKNQSPQKAQEQLLQAIALAPTHISLYQLTVEAGTQFGARSRKGERLQQPEEELVNTYALLEKTLADHHYSLYEVSNASLLGQESKHNSLYWTLGDYLALGAGAHGLIKEGKEAYRWSNQNNPQQYLKALDLTQITKEEQYLDEQALLEESILVGFRLSRGLEVTAGIKERYGVKAQALISQGLLESYECDPGKVLWRATSKGKLILDHITYELILSDPATR